MQISAVVRGCHGNVEVGNSGRLIVSAFRDIVLRINWAGLRDEKYVVEKTCWSLTRGNTIIIKKSTIS